MARLQTTGTNCCGMISVSDLNDDTDEECEVGVLEEFKGDTLLDSNQPYGETDFYEFHSLMDAVIIVFPKHILQAVLSEQQYYRWHPKLKKYGFKLVRKFKNPTGDICYYYMRVPSETRRSIEKGER